MYRFQIQLVTRSFRLLDSHEPRQHVRQHLTGSNGLHYETKEVARASVFGLTNG